MYDIYGNPLRPGYCEVHPDIPEPWPCSVCELERVEREREKELERERENWIQNQLEEKARNESAK